jgi:hypothetical protein
MEEEQNIDEAQLDVLDMLMRPPLPGTMQEAMAYWEYLDCQTVSCDAWLWRRNLGKPDWGIRCWKCGWEWRNTFQRSGSYFKYWNPIDKCPAR